MRPIPRSPTPTALRRSTGFIASRTSPGAPSTSRATATSSPPISYARRGENPSVGQCLGGRLALCQRALDSHLGGGLGPAVALACPRAPCLADRPRDSEPPAAARARSARPLCLGALAL